MAQLAVYLERIKEQDFNWKVRQVDGVELSEWQKGPGYPSLDAYCKDEIQKRLWKGSSVDHGECDAYITFWV